MLQVQGQAHETHQAHEALRIGHGFEERQERVWRQVPLSCTSPRTRSPLLN
eukprot:CAMPEP_0115521936 /NCGR_PEP_ID=MMETSP0271-20121206/79812_1 /TAXON_ID=71861 /ORGANISM="Scrippsiella trochoidea, Strain CCMP3099" /LENGTH=50 /DNA_ID=CAMNT_0002953201 /DNA_START=1 /DNA_END=150 /DNA_ORIENTATION=-